MDRDDVSGKAIRLLIILRLAIDFFTCNVHKKYVAWANMNYNLFIVKKCSAVH